MLNSYPGTCQKTKNPGLSQVAQEEKLTMAAEVPAVAFGSRSDADLRQTIQLTKCKMNSYSPKSQTGGGLDSKCHLLYQDSNIY